MLLSVSKMKKHDAHAGIPHIVVNIQLHFKENLPLQSLPHGIFSLYIQSPEQMSHIFPKSKRFSLQINKKGRPSSRFKLMHTVITESV